MSYVLWLVSWYPNKTDAFAGDFIERHAKAVSLNSKLVIIFVTKDPAKNKPDIECVENENLIVYKGYYRKTSNSWLEKFISNRKYITLQKKIFKKIIREHGLPSLVHVHVAMKAGLLALFIRKKYGIKYIVTEHWTGYFKNAIKNIYNSGYFFKRYSTRILSQASLLLPVTHNLGKIISSIVNTSFTVIPNVVDTNLFCYSPKQQNKFRFIHVSTMSYQKDPESIIRVAKQLWDEGFEFELVMIGCINEAIKRLANKLLLTDEQIVFKSEMPYSQVAVEMQESSAFILFSRIENLPCVILEALCCGLPVISSDVGGIKEVVTESNGILVSDKNETALKEAMKIMILNYSNYNRQSIAVNAALKFNYAEVGKEIDNVYRNMTK